MNNIYRQMHIVIPLLAVVFLTGCAAKSDVEELQKQARYDRQQQRELYKELEDELSKKIEITSSPVQARQADIWSELSSIKQNMAVMSGHLDDIDFKLSELSGEGNSTASLPQVAADVEAIKFALEHQLAVDMDEVMRLVIKSRPAPKQPSQEAEETENAILSQKVENQDGSIDTVQIEVANSSTAVDEQQADPAQLLYDKAYSNFGQREYDKARSLWAEFTTTFPSHKLIPNAIFWQGECWYQLGDYQRAILAYQDVIKKHQKSTKYKYALLKQGISFYHLDKKDLGKLVLSDLVSKYPSSTEAARAKQFIKDN